MGFIRKRKRQPFITPGDVARFAEMGPVDWAEVFSQDFSPDELQAIELAFGDGAISVITYLLDIPAPPRATNREMALCVFGNVIAKSEFHLRFRPEFDRVAVNSWRDDQLSSTDLSRLPATPPLPTREDLVAEAATLVDDGWYAICFLVSSEMSKSLDVKGREVEFLNSVFRDPRNYRESFVDFPDD